jgi:hypothetical protein
MPFPRPPGSRGRRFSISVLLLVMLWSQAPAQIQLESGLSLELAVEPGGSYAGMLVLRNLGQEPRMVRFYLSDYRFNADGQTFYEKPGTLARSNSSWISLPASTLVVPASQVLTVPYEIEVPDGPGLAGTYWSILMVENVPGGQAGEVQDQFFGLQQVVRYGVQVATTFRNGGRTMLSFGNPGFQRGSGDERFFLVDVENTGETFVRPRFYLDLYDDGGRRIERFEAPPRRLYPGTSVRARFDLPNLGPGSYNAIIIADAGAENVYGAAYELQIDAR